MEKLKEELKYSKRGITLISLVVMIIVLIILASVSINLLFGENGLITMAQKTKNEYEEAAKNEEQQLAGVFERNYVTYNGQLHVDGINLMNEHNEIIQLKGVNLGGRDYLYLYDYTIIENLKKSGVNCVRIGLDTNYYTNQTYMQYMKNIIDNCIKLDLYVDLVFWNNGNPNENLLLAKEYFNYWVNTYVDSVNIIYEINNEATDGVTWDNIKAYSNEIIPEIRTINKDAVIIVGTPYFDSAAIDVIRNELDFSNIMYAIHRYPTNAESTNLISLKNFNTAYYNNIPLIITEWSVGDSSGVSTNLEEANKLFKLMKEYKTSWMYYTLDPSGVYSFDILKEYTNSLEEEYLTDSGKYFLSILKDEKKESYSDYDYMLAERSSLYFESIRETIKKIEFKNNIDIPNGATQIRDVTKYGTGKVISYIEGEKLVIAADNNYVYAPENSRNLFGSFINLSSIDFTYFNTRYAQNIEVMFYNTGLIDIDLSMLDLSNVTDISEMVRRCSNLENLNISNIDFDNITDTNTLFDNTRNGITIYVKDIKAAQSILNELNLASITGNIYYKDENTWKEFI